MNRLILGILLITLISCQKEEHKLIAVNNDEIAEPVYGPLFTATIPTRNPYEIGLKIESTKNDTYFLIVNMKLYDGAYFVSPFSKVNYKGRFKMTINDESQIRLTDELIETPNTTEVYGAYPFVNDPENWVKQNTTYRQPFSLLTEKNFSIKGNIQFTIEPRCTSEFIPFTITSENGKLDIKVDGC